jgi:hypothetical protein
MPEPLKSQQKRRWIWRLLTIATVVFLLVAAVSFLLAPMREAKKLEQSLNDRFGSANEYTPAVDGTLSAQQIESFIRIRQALRPECHDYEKVLNSLVDLASLDSDEEISDKEKASRGIAGFKGLFSAAPNMVEFMEARNSALLAEEMGLGEYLYLYVAAYSKKLAHSDESPYAQVQETDISPRARSDFMQIIESQLLAIEASDPFPTKQVLTRTLSAEIEALQKDDDRSPWPNGPAETTAESLSAWTDQLDTLYCDGMVRLELQQKNKGLNFKG